MKDYLQSGKLTDDESYNKWMITESEKFFIDSGTNILHRIYQPNPKVCPKLIYEQVVLPNSMVSEVLRSCHDISYHGGHANVRQTYLKLIPHVYFRKMFVIVENYVKSCEVCARRKTPRNKRDIPTMSPALVGCSEDNGTFDTATWLPKSIQDR